MSTTTAPMRKIDAPALDKWTWIRYIPIAVALAVLGALVLSLFQVQPRLNETALEQQAATDNLTVFNVEICGLSATQLYTPVGHFNVQPSAMETLNGPLKAGKSSLIELAYNPDRTVMLVGSANMHSTVFYCR